MRYYCQQTGDMVRISIPWPEATEWWGRLSQGSATGSWRLTSKTNLWVYAGMMLVSQNLFNFSTWITSRKKDELSSLETFSFSCDENTDLNGKIYWIQYLHEAVFQKPLLWCSDLEILSPLVRFTYNLRVLTMVRTTGIKENFIVFFSKNAPSIQIWWRFDGNIILSLLMYYVRAVPNFSHFSRAHWSVAVSLINLLPPCP